MFAPAFAYVPHACAPVAMEFRSLLAPVATKPPAVPEVAKLHPSNPKPRLSPGYAPYAAASSCASRSPPSAVVVVVDVVLVVDVLDDSVVVEVVDVVLVVEVVVVLDVVVELVVLDVVVLVVVVLVVDVVPITTPNVRPTSMLSIAIAPTFAACRRAKANGFTVDAEVCATLVDPSAAGSTHSVVVSVSRSDFITIR
jgi:hypothetical protein